MTYRTFIIPRHIYSGPGSLESLGAFSGKRAFVVTDQVIRNLGIVARVEEIVQEKNMAIKGAGLDSAHFHSEIDRIVAFYMERIGKNIAQLRVERRRIIGLHASAEETKQLYIHAWNGTRADLSQPFVDP